MTLNPAAKEFVLPRTMNPTANVFVPLTALNAPPLPKFERAYIEFQEGVETMEAIAKAKHQYLRREISEYSSQRRFNRLSVRLLKLSKYITAHISIAFYAGTFEDIDWIHRAVADTMILYHKYSWSMLKMIDMAQGKY